MAGQAVQGLVDPLIHHTITHRMAENALAFVATGTEAFAIITQHGWALRTMDLVALSTVCLQGVTGTKLVAAPEGILMALLAEMGHALAQQAILVGGMGAVAATALLFTRQQMAMGRQHLLFHLRMAGVAQLFFLSGRLGAMTALTTLAKRRMEVLA